MNQTAALPVSDISRREAWAALVYVALYIPYLTLTLESELLHWVTLVAVPLVLVLMLRPSGARDLTQTLSTFGLRRGNLARGVGWALLAGLAIGVFQASGGSEHAQEIREVVRSGQALWALPLAFVAMVATAGFTEEFFFRGFLQTRITALSGSGTVGLLGSAVLFGLYHVPYAYLHPNWPSSGDLGAAFGSAMGQGGIGGLLLGGLYLVSRGNLLACVVLHSAINAVWAMTMIRFGG
jgi:membrane protease YdiL (CAAX protease family)